ncbi:MAG: DUF4212 domain-containing protein [Deltaproteobacteria bacterium]|nr:DUF4212 domain-containing protein [Deltaproteobacteria bacterium]
MEEYWRKNIRVMISLLVVWFIAGYLLSIFLVVPLNSIHLGGFPLGFWFAQQGSIYIFVILIFVYCYIMRKLDKEYELDE